MSAEIRGLSKTDIEVIYTPTTYTTAEAQIEFRTTEFDSRPVHTTIMASAAPTQTNIRKGMNESEFAREVIHERQDEGEDEYVTEVRKTKGKTLL